MFGAASGDAVPAEDSVVNRMTCSPIHASVIRAEISGSSIRPFALASASTASNSRWNSSWRPNMATPRSTPSVPIATRQPSPGAPTTSSAAASASVKNTSLNSEVPVSWTMGRTSTPAWRIGTSRQDSPRCRREPASVLASRKHQSAN